MSGQFVHAAMERLRANLRAAGSRIAWAGALSFLAVLSGLTGVGFLLAVLHMRLSIMWGVQEASLAMGGVLLVLAALLMLGARRAIGQRPSGPATSTPAAGLEGAAPPRSGPADPTQLAAQMGEDIGAQAAVWARSHPVLALAVALAAGVAVGANPGLRRKLTGRHDGR